MFVKAVVVSSALFLVIGAVYLALDWYLRLDTVRRYEARYAAGEGGGLSREDFIDQGLARYRRSPEKKILAGLFAIPVIVILLLSLVAK
ncbi:MAG: hypothetical protein AAGE83_15115 [Pseudomonadota bacterium]